MSSIMTKITYDQVTRMIAGRDARMSKAKQSFDSDTKMAILTLAVIIAADLRKGIEPDYLFPLIPQSGDPGIASIDDWLVIDNDDSTVAVDALILEFTRHSEYSFIDDCKCSPFGKCVYHASDVSCIYCGITI